MLELTVKKEIEVVIKATGDEVQVLSSIAICARCWMNDKHDLCVAKFGEKRVSAMFQLMEDIEAIK